MQLAVQVEQTVLQVLAELKPGNPLYTNVEFYAGVVMDRCGLPRELFTPTFAVSRVIGWCANIAEQAAARQLIRPAARYVGPPAPEPVPVRGLSHRYADEMPGVIDGRRWLRQRIDAPRDHAWQRSSRPNNGS